MTTVDRRTFTFLRSATAMALLMGSAHAEAPPVYDPDPNHPWNQLYYLLYLRGADGEYALHEEVLAPVLWDNTRYLLEEPSHSSVIAFLDEFIKSDAGKLIEVPIKRAVFQRDLWTVFDWAIAGYHARRSPGWRENHNAGREPAVPWAVPKGTRLTLPGPPGYRE